MRIWNYKATRLETSYTYLRWGTNTRFFFRSTSDIQKDDIWHRTATIEAIAKILLIIKSIVIEFCHRWCIRINAIASCHVQIFFNDLNEVLFHQLYLIFIFLFAFSLRWPLFFYGIFAVIKLVSKAWCLRFSNLSIRSTSKWTRSY